MTRRAGLAASLVALVPLVAASLALLPVSGPALAGSDDVRVGTLTLRPCHVAGGALCGSLKRLWEPGNPGAGSLRVGFAVVPARDRSRPALGTLVPHEGGPGYATTASGSGYAQMYGALLERRNLLLVDQRGTGLSAPIDCPLLQNSDLPYADAAAACGASLGDRADDYTTALSVDDVAAVVKALRLGRVDLYGDSYGTFFTQVFAGRHPDLVRSVVLDSAYPAYGESAWYRTQTPAMRRAFRAVCERSPACAEGGRPFLSALSKVLRLVRAEPWRGVSHDADGTRAKVTVDGPGLVSVAYGATFTPTFYREATAALRSALAGDRAPLLRLVAEATGGGNDAGPVRPYSEGLDAAVACHDYPQLYDMSAPPAVRQQQYAAALDARSASHPGTYGPFTVHEYAASDWQMLDWCTRWPSAPASNPAAPPEPPSGHYPDVPVLVLSGELDSITTAAEGALVVGQFPDAQRVVVRNSFHVTAVGDTDDCAQRLVRTFVVRPAAALPASLLRCARSVPPIRAMGRFPGPLPADAPPARVARLAALTVADLQDRWWNNYSGHGVGLHGGKFRYAGSDVVRFHLDRFRLVRGLAVSGTAVWDRYGETMTVSLDLPRGHLEGSWDTRTPSSRAVLSGTLDHRPVRLAFRAP